MGNSRVDRYSWVRVSSPCNPPMVIILTWAAFAVWPTTGGATMPKILVSDPISQEGIALLQKHFEVDVKTGLDKDQLIAIIGEYDALAEAHVRNLS